MKRYNPKEIEPKWQAYWDENQTYKADLTSDKPKYYAMSMFNYPSGAGIHIGHAMNYTISDVLARFKRQQGYESYHPVGWDAFGLPAENYAIKSGVSPQKSMATIIPGYHKQYKAMGWSNDWSKEIATHEPEYYRWTQWIFAQMYKHGLAYQDSRMQWWCAKDNTVLSNEQVIDGKCWRHDGADDPLVDKKEVKQWFFKITDYADEILEATDDLDWTESVKLAQKNWIGKSTGAEVTFNIAEADDKANFVILHGYTGHADRNWLPWIKSDLEKKGYEVEVPQMPNTDTPKESEQVSYVLENCHFDENTILVGHSLGGAVAMKVLQKLKHPIRKLVLVAPVIEPAFRGPKYTNENPNKPRMFVDTFDLTYDYELVKQRTSEIVILSENKEAATRRPYLQYLADKFDVPLLEADGERIHFTGDTEPFVLASLLHRVTVFTTRPDTLYGATFLVLAPELDLVERITTPEQKNAVDTYRREVTKKTEIERQASKDKTGVFTGAYAINPLSGDRMPIWIADYVLSGYGTGAIMAVPAHDERDNEFAKAFDLPIRQVIAERFIHTGNEHHDEAPLVPRNVVCMVTKHPTEDKILMAKPTGSDFWASVMGGIDEGETPEEAARRELLEESGLNDIKSLKVFDTVFASEFYAQHKKENRIAYAHTVLVELNSLDAEKISADEESKQTLEWMTPDQAKEAWVGAAGLQILEQAQGVIRPMALEGRLINSGEYDGMSTSDAREKIVADLAEKGIATEKTNYKLRDWSVSRQRYWGAPIPIIHCPNDGIVLVADDQLPVVLPELTDFAPNGDGRSALARATDWLNVTCPECGGPAERETDTLDTYICSSWYMLRYLSPHDKDQAFDTATANKWMPVDFYNGADHATAHMIYARFITRFFSKLGLLENPEPFKRFLYNGKVMASDGTMFSKSKGNGVDPLEIINQGYGADALRTYLMFAAPLDLWVKWDSQGVPGTYRFLNRVWNIVQEFVESEPDDDVSEDVLRIIHPAIHKVTADLEDQKYNTAIAALMKATNELYTLKAKTNFNSGRDWRFALESLISLVAPFAPHMAEELWHELGHEDSVNKGHWPNWDDAYLVSSTVTIAVQINGKLRTTINAPVDTDESTISKQATADAKIADYLVGKEVIKVIYIPNKLLNFVIK